MPALQKISLQETVGDKTISLQTGTLAKQAGGSVTCHLGDSIVMSAATVAKNPKEVSFVPLTSDYRERAYAAGRVPGGFFKREMRPRDKETLTSRLVDRPIRPLFPEGWNHETSIQSIVVSCDMVNDPDILAINAASAALMLSDAPFNGPVGGVRIARVNGAFVLFPTWEERETAELELVVAGKKDALLMVEGSAHEASEELFVSALEIAQKEINKLCALQLELVKRSEAAGRKVVKHAVKAPAIAPAVLELVATRFTEPVKKHLRFKLDKHGLDARIDEIKDAIKKEVEEKAKTDPAFADGLKWVSKICEDILYTESRALTLVDRVRPDGRGFEEVRPIDILMKPFPRLHGSAVFTRGQTQAFCNATLGTPGDMQIMDVIQGEYKDRFMLHYNFPSFSVGEVRPERGPGRREIGHGALARRSLAVLLPPEEEFPYTLRVVSEIWESNGSSSMASVCGGSLSLFDAGVPMKAACAGIAMGLVIEGGKYAVLTDIAGIEDHNGDMDFKVAGTRAGITGFQMDMKVEGLSISIMKEALAQALRGRLFILDKMDAVLPEPRKELSQFAPRLFRITIPTDKIGALIGPGGKNIRRLIDTYGVQVDVEDDGSVFIAGVDPIGCEQAKAEVEALTLEAEVGKIYKGHVVSIKEFGAFIEIFPGKEGLLHVSQIDVKRVDRVSDVLKMGDEVEVKCLEIDENGKIRLSRKAVLSPGSENDSPGPRRDGPPREGAGHGGPRRGGGPRR
ncbi:MAG TPA: polyribonucleotide nucleotidyltransferase [Elusimicrobia bacterium]|nr:MAG: polyribonucleotide nucleotidyltransferase [Elusimicrobia bacterium GWA2_66_18]HAZ08669.1 polyribonucleotide nucleotidyltransferase [Elusimicrobiota bacterium]